MSLAPSQRKTLPAPRPFVPEHRFAPEQWLGVRNKPLTVNAIAPGVDAGAGDATGAQAVCIGAEATGDAVGTFVPQPPQNTHIIQCRTALTAKLAHCLSPSRTESISLVHLPAIGLARLLTRKFYTPVARAAFERVVAIDRA